MPSRLLALAVKVHKSRSPRVARHHVGPGRAVGSVTTLEKRDGLGDQCCKSRADPSAMHGDAAEMLGVDVKHLQTVEHGFGHMLPGNGLGTGPSCDSTREKRWARTTARTRGAILGVLVGYLQSELFEIHFEATRDRPPETWVESLPHLGLLALVHSLRHRSLINWVPSGVISEFAVADLNVADFPTRRHATVPTTVMKTLRR